MVMFRPAGISATFSVPVKVLAVVVKRAGPVRGYYVKLNLHFIIIFDLFLPMLVGCISLSLYPEQL